MDIAVMATEPSSFDVFVPSRDTSLFAQSVRQIISGLIVNSIDIIVFQVALWFSLSVFLSAMASYIFAVMSNFILSRRYVIGETTKQNKMPLTQAMLYLGASLLSLGFTQLTLWVFAVRLGFNPVLVKILSLPFIFIWSVIVARYIVFSKKQ